jgi:DNA-binding response OmpR family regulator
MTRLLLIEDNADLAYGLRNNFEIEGYEVDVAADGMEGLGRVLHGDYDLVILDLMLPGVDGFTVLQTLRELRVRPPVLVLSAKGDRQDKLRSFGLGADDYVTKPFDLLELLARTRALLRRSALTGGRSLSPLRPGTPVMAPAQWRRRSERTASLGHGDIVVDIAAGQVLRSGRPVELRRREFELLLAFCGNPGIVLSRQRLLRDVWGHRVAVRTRTVDVHVGQLRRKIECDPSHPRHIITIEKVGYRFDP